MISPSCNEPSPTRRRSLIFVPFLLPRSSSRDRTRHRRDRQARFAGRLAPPHPHYRRWRWHPHALSLATKFWRQPTNVGRNGPLPCLSPRSTARRRTAVRSNRGMASACTSLPCGIEIRAADRVSKDERFDEPKNFRARPLACQRLLPDAYPRQSLDAVSKRAGETACIRSSDTISSDALLSPPQIAEYKRDRAQARNVDGVCHNLSHAARK